jgi:hypothetical protein
MLFAALLTLTPKAALLFIQEIDDITFLLRRRGFLTLTIVELDGAKG